MPIILEGPTTVSVPVTGESFTLNKLIEYVRSAARDRPSRDTLNSGLSSSATIFTVTSGAEVALQDYVDIDLEVVRVVAKTSQTVISIAARGQYGTDAATHANGAEVLTGWRHSRDEYRRAINYALDAIAIGGFGKTIFSEKSYGSSRLVEVPSGAIRAFAYHSSNFKPLPGASFVRVPTTLSASGRAIRLSAYNPGFGTAYIEYESAWPHLNLLADTLDEEYPDHAIDLILLGAKAYLLDPEAFARVAFTEPHARLHQHATPVDSSRLAAREAMAMFLARRTEVSVPFRGRRFLAWVKG